MEPDYSEKKIEVVEGGEAIRLRPKLYFGRCFLEGNLDNLPLEIACHALDEVIEGNCSKIEICLERDTFFVRYDAGLSLETDQAGEHTIAEKIMTMFFACHNLKKNLSVGDELCELGMATINAASEWCELSTISGGKQGEFRFEKGITVSKKITPIDENESTFIKIKPDNSLFEGLSYSKNGVENKANLLMKRFPGVTITVEKR